MRVLIVASIDPAVFTGGAERVAALLADGLSSQAHDVTVLSLENPEGRDDGSVPWSQVHLPVDLPYHPGEPEASSPLEEARWHLKELRNSEATERIDEALEDKGPFDVASVHNVQGLSFGVFDVLAENDVPTVYTNHDFKLATPVLNRQPEGPKQLLSPLWPIYRAWVRRQTRPVDRFITPSRYISRALEEEGALDPDHVDVVPNGVPVDVPHSIDEPARRLTMYGVLSPHKGMIEFAEAFHASDADIELHIAGTGALQDKVQAMADRDPRITYLGYLEDDDLQEQLADSLAVVVPSLWSENCPMVVLESFAAGTPVVHTARGGLSELCPPGELGLQLPRDVSEWTTFIDGLDTEELVEMRPRCREVAEERYSLEAMVEGYERTFEDVRREM